MTVTVMLPLPVCYIAADDQGTGRTAMDTDLTASMTYHYQVIAQVDGNDVARSNIVAVITAAANDPTAPRYPVAVPDIYQILQVILERSTCTG